MDFGLFAINYGTCGDPEAAVIVARHAEAVGFESVWTGEHFVLPTARPRGSSLEPTLPMLDSLVVLTLVAAETSTLRLGTGVLVLPLHSPIVLAKALTSLDAVSAGRLIVGVGVGYIAEEFAAAGVPLRERGARTDDHLLALRTLWESAAPRHDGRFVRFADIDAHPRPTRRLPIVVGGESEAALARAVRHGDGWYGFSLNVAETRACATRLAQLAEELGRPPGRGPLELTVTPTGRLDRATVDQYAELGVSRLVLLPEPEADQDRRHHPVPLDRIRANLDDVAGRLMTG